MARLRFAGSLLPGSTRARAGAPEPGLSRALTVHAAAVAGLSFAHSLRARGLARTLLFTALGHLMPSLGEYLAVRVFGILRHHAQPQVKGVPLAIILGWYNVGYGTFAIMEIILSRVGPRGGRPALASATALAATSLDLLLDPAGLELGLWEWRRGGMYAAGIDGPNGERGVPLLNFAGWLALVGGVTLAYLRLGPGGPPGEEETGPPGTERTAALLLLLYYLPAAAWAARRSRRRYLLYSAPFLAALWAATRGPASA